MPKTVQAQGSLTVLLHLVRVKHHLRMVVTHQHQAQRLQQVRTNQYLKATTRKRLLVEVLKTRKRLTQKLEQV